ncbi:MAG: nitroreductase family protein [Phycisphaerales bacterium]|nr:nitroreductase family protein [Phycisphaerales bacterium]
MPVDTIPYSLPQREPSWQIERGRDLLAEMRTRRSCRFFSDRPVGRDVLELALEVAHAAPSGANRKPWRFVVVDDPALKKEIRVAAEAEERESYDHRMPQEWLDALEPIGTNWEKPFLEVAPYLVVIFRIDWEDFGEKRIKNYYPAESAGLASGFFLTACHMLGLATLTHTPSPMNFLREILQRPPGEKPYLLIPVGYPADDCTVPDLKKKPLAEALQWNCEAG